MYKRGEYWQFRMWLAKENKYVRKSLRTRSETTAVERGKAAYLVNLREPAARQA